MTPQQETFCSFYICKAEEFLWRWGNAVPLEKLGALRAVCGVWGVFCKIFEQEPGKLSLHRECGNSVASPFSVIHDEQSRFFLSKRFIPIVPTELFSLTHRGGVIAQTRSFMTFFNFRLVFLHLNFFDAFIPDGEAWAALSRLKASSLHHQARAKLYLRQTTVKVRIMVKKHPFGG